MTIIGKDFVGFLKAVEAAGNAGTPGNLLCDALRRAQLVCLVETGSAAALALTRSATNQNFGVYR